MKKRIVLTFAFLWSMIAGILAQEYTADNLPMPYLQDLRMHTCNPDNILSASTVASIDSLFFNLEREKGVQAIAIVAKRVEGGDPFSFGMSVAKKYGIGNKNNTGLLVILATEDRAYQILTGDGLEGSLPDAICSRIENRFMLPFLKESNWDQAMLNTVEALCGYINEDETIVGSLNLEDDDDFYAMMAALGLVGGGMGVIGASIYLNERKKKHCPNCKQYKLKQISKVLESKKKGVKKYKVTYLCENCGHTLMRTETEYDDTYWNSGGGSIFIGGSRSGFGRSIGGGFGGGSFGGGHFGGGGAGGRF